MRQNGNVAILAFALAAAGLAQAPNGWKMRVDRSTSASDADAPGEVKFVAEGSGFHATNPQAAVYWNPANTITGPYTLKGTFTLVEPSNHTNYYGLVFGGKDLAGAGQSYLYFTVAQDGTWLLKQRQGEGTSTIARGSNGAIKKPDASGKSTNALEVRVAPSKIDYVVPLTTVHSTPKTGATASTDGLYGMRVNHFLNVQMSGVTATKS